MSEYQSNIARRDFLRLCAASGAGLVAGFHRHLAKSVACPAVGTPPVGDIVVGLEIGTSKVCATVGERLPDGIIKILGIGQVPSRGVTRYGIVDFEAASACVREALADTEAKSDVMIRSVVLAVAGTKIAPYHSGPTWERIFEWEKICYGDRGDGVLRQINLADCKRARDCQVVAGTGARIENNIRCVKALGIDVKRIVFAPVAAAEAVLSANQKERGALVIDMGAGTTDYGVYAEGALVQSDCFAVGGQNIANDLSLGLCIPLARAEKLAIEEGSVRLDPSLRGERIVIEAEPEFRGRVVERELLNTIVHHRVRQAFGLVKCRLVNSGMRLDSLLAGVHLTGGCSLLRGIDGLAQEVFGVPAHFARVKGIMCEPAGAIELPQYSCALSLVKFS